jgi:outer membrane protein assembly factor BamA
MVRSIIHYFSAALFCFFLLCRALNQVGYAAPVSVILSNGSQVEIRTESGGLEVQLPEELISQISGMSESAFSQKLIKELVRSGKYKDVVIRKSDAGPGQKQIWTVFMSPQRMIYDVTVSGLGLLDENLYKRRLRSRAGAIFLEDALEDDVLTLSAALRERGYPYAQVETVQVRGIPNGTVSIEFSVKRGSVCRLSEVRAEGGESFLQVVSLPIELGAVCNIPLIKKNLAAEEERLRQAGYLDARIAIASVLYSKDQSSAVLTVRADRGPFTRIEAIDLATGAIKDDFVKRDGGISSFDLTNLSEEDLKREVLNFYLESGYAQATVTGPSIEQLASGDKVMKFFVQKGPKILVGQVNFVGDRLPVSRVDALDAMNLNPGIFSQSVPFREARLADYRDNLQALLLNAGYGDAQVDPPKVLLSRSGGTAKLEFTIRLGKIYVFSELSVLGLPEGFSINQSEIDDVVDLDDPLSAESIKLLREAVRKQLIESGHYYAKVKDNPVLQKETEDTKKILLVLEVDAGPIVTVRNVYTEGETYGKAERIKMVSMLQRGTVFSPSSLERARRRILKYDLFSNVAVEAFDLSAMERRETELDVVIRTTGRSGYSLALSPGYGSRNGYRFGVEFVRNEVNESGLRFNAYGSLSQDKEQLPIGNAPQQIGRKITLGLTEPLIRVGQWVSPVDARILAGTEVSNQSFETRLFETYEFSFKWRPVFWDQDFDFEWGVAREWSDTISERFEPLQAINTPTLQIHEVVLRASFDTRDSIEWARRGMFHEIQTQHARFGLDSDVSYDRYTVSSSFFFPFLARWSHALSLGFVTISDVRNKDKSTVTAPASRRSALTGRAAVRGFPEFGRSLGPLIWLDLDARQGSATSECQNAVRSIGGTNLVYGKYELRYRTSYLANMLGLAWFVDSGTAFFTNPEIDTIRKKIESDIKTDARFTSDCSLEQVRIYQPPEIGKPSTRSPANYLNSSYVSSGIGLRFIIPNFAAISFDWGIPVRDPAEQGAAKCRTVSEAEASDEAPGCIKRDKQDRLLGTIPFPGAFYFGIGATL